MENTSDRSSSPLSADEQSLDDKSIVTLRFITSSKEAGSIIGKKGDNVKRIREESCAKINISDASFAERIVSVMGSTSQTLKAFNMIAAKFEDDMQGLGSDGSGSSQVIFRLVVPNANCGSLIGKGGNNIRELRESTGASIQVANEMLPNSTERAVTITGSPEAIAPCIRRLCAIAIETKPKVPVITYQPCNMNSMMPVGNVYGGRQQFGMPPMNMMHPPRSMMKGRPSPLADMSSIYATQRSLLASNYSAIMRGGYQPGVRSHGRQITKHLEVPNELIGTIIGRHGMKISEIRQVSRANIKISNAEEGCTTRQVTIIGTADCVDSAVYLINAIQAKYSKN